MFRTFFVPEGWGFALSKKFPGGGVLARFFCPRGQCFALSLCPRGGDLPFQKNSPGVCPGGWSGLELTDKLSLLYTDYLY